MWWERGGNGSPAVVSGVAVLVAGEGDGGVERRCADALRQVQALKEDEGRRRGVVRSEEKEEDHGERRSFRRRGGRRGKHCWAACVRTDQLSAAQRSP